MDRLTAIDAGFLAQEKPNTHMHIGGLVLVEGPPPPLEDFLAHVRSRLGLVPRYRQKLAFPPLESGLPMWVDDPTFNLDYHVRHTALPQPGDRQSLLRLAARIFSQRLDRSKPLWELWLIEGLDSAAEGGDGEAGRGGFAILSKTHHALVDGVSGADLGTVLFDLSPEGTPLPEPEPWVPRPEPTRAQLVARGLETTARRVAGLAGSTLADPGRLLDRGREVAVGVGEVARAALTPPSSTPFNVEPGPHRRFCTVEAELKEFKEVKDVLGGTVNDVVLACVAGGLRHFLRERGVQTDEVMLRACVPVSVRDESRRSALGNEITIMLAPLPVDVADPVERFEAVRAAMDDLKESKQAIGAAALADMQDFAPPTVFAQASRLQFSFRMYNLLVTNVPGPQFPIYVLGRRMRSIFPIPFLAGRRALAVAVMSYDGGMDFGLLGDYDALPDLDVVGEGIEGSLAELLAIARKRKRAQARAKPRRKSTAG
jgi:WS/DGAT/MGAT family acyltransferase